jgi:hypothetical protein
MFTHMAREAGAVVELKAAAFGSPRSVVVALEHLAPLLALLRGALRRARAPETGPN